MDEEDYGVEQQDAGEQDPLQLGRPGLDDDLVTGSSNQSETMPPPIPFDGTEGFSASASNDMPPPIPFSEMPPSIPFSEMPPEGYAAEPEHGVISNFLRGLTRELLLQNWASEPLKGLGRLMSPDDKDNFFTRVGENLQRGTDALIAPPDQGSIAGGIGAGLGDIGPMIAATLLGGPAALAVGAAQMGLGGVESQSEAAEKAGASPENVKTAGYLGGAVGAGAGLALGAVAGKILPEIARTAPGLSNFATTVFKGAAREGTIFTGIGEAMAYLDDKIAQNYYDPNSEYHLDLKRLATEFGTGAVLGGARGMGGRYVAGKIPGEDVRPPVFDAAEDARNAGASENVKTGVGTAQEQAPPNTNVTGIGNEKAPNNEPGAPAGSFAKRWLADKLAAQEPGAGDNVVDLAAEREARSGLTQLREGEVPQDIRAALETGKPSGQYQVPENPGFDWVRGEPSDGQERFHPEPENPNPELNRGVPIATPESQLPRSGEPTPGPADVTKGSVGQPRRPQELLNAPAGAEGDAPGFRPGRPFVQGEGPDVRVGRTLEDLRPPEPRGRDLTGEGPGGIPSQAELHGEPRKPRILEDLTRPLTPSGEEVQRAPGMAERQPKRVKEVLAEYGVKDANGNFVSHARNAGEARKFTDQLRIANETMQKFKDQFARDFDVNKPEDVAALRSLAKEAVAYAKENGWERYLPRKVKEGTAHEALWLNEVEAFAGRPKTNKTTGKIDFIQAKRDNRRYQPADFITRERMIRSGFDDAVQGVRDERLDEGTRAKQRFTPGEVEVTEAGNVGDTGRRVDTTNKDFPMIEEPRADESVVIKGERFKPLTTRKLKDVLDEKFVSTPDRLLTGISDEHMDIAREVAARDPNVRVHELNAADFVKAAKAVFADQSIDWSRARVNGFYDSNSHQIILPTHASPEVILHEAVHAITARRIIDNPDMEVRIDKLRRYVAEFAYPPMWGRAFHNAHEFLAYGMSKKAFQKMLSKIILPDGMAKELGLPEQAGKVTNGFQAFVQTVRQVLGLPEGHYSALEGVIKLTDEASKMPLSPKRGQPRDTVHAMVDEVRTKADDLITKKVKAPWAMWMRDFDKIAQATDPLFGGAESNPIRIIQEAVEKRRVTAITLAKEGDALTREDFRLMQKDPEEWNKLQNLMAAESYYQRYGDRPINKQGFNTNDKWQAQRDSKHPELERMYNDLKPEYQDLRAQHYAFAEDRHSRINDSLAAARLEKLLDFKDKALAKRVMEDTHTQADWLKLGDNNLERQSNLEVLQAIASRNKIEGPYSPMIRRGRYAVTGLYKIVDTGKDIPAQRDENSRQFAKRADADDFATQQHSGTAVTPIYVDKTTGKNFDTTTEIIKGKTDPAGNDLDYAKDRTFTAADMKTNPNIEKRWKAEVTRGYLNMHDTLAKANAHYDDMLKTGEFDDTLTVQPRKFQPHTDATSLASLFDEGKIENTLRHNTRYQALSKSDQELFKQAMAEQFLQNMSGTRNIGTRLHRNYVRGADENLALNHITYNHDTSHRLSNLEHGNVIDNARSRAEEMVTEDGNKYAGGRRKVLNEVDKRLQGIEQGGFSVASGQMGPGMHRVMGVSYAARLGTPGFTIRNLFQHPMMTGAEVGARHGFGATYREMAKLYKETGSGKTLWQGIKETGKAFAGKESQPTFVADMLSRLKDPHERAMVENLIKNGAVDADAGFQIPEFVKRGPEGVDLDWNIGFGGAERKNAAMRGVEKGIDTADMALHWTEEVTRAMPRAAETINRVNAGVLAYRMELRSLLKKGVPEEKARAAAEQYATRTVDNTQYRYTDTNKPNWARNPWFRPAFQFKQFGKSTMEFMGRHAANAIDREADPAVRKEGRRALGAMFVSHTIVAGALGLPWEPVRAFLIGAKQVIPGTPDWDDVENGIRSALTGFGNLAGLNEHDAKKLGEVLSRGLPRLAGIDLSTGLGIDNMLLFGSPRSGTDRDQDNNLMAWMAQMALGAPGTLGIQMMHGMRDIINGNYAEGVEKLMPLKIGSDVIKAEEGLRHGKVDARGREKTRPYTPYEAAMKTIGLPPSIDAETGAFQHQVNQQGQQIKDAHSRAISNWLSADGDNKGAAYKAAIDAGVLPKSLTDAASRLRSERSRTINGVVTNRDSRPIAQRLKQIYNME